MNILRALWLVSATDRYGAGDGCRFLPTTQLAVTELIVMASVGRTQVRRGRVSFCLLGAIALAVGLSTAAYSPPRAASAVRGTTAIGAAPVSHDATLLPTGRFVRPAGLQYNLGDFP